MKLTIPALPKLPPKHRVRIQLIPETSWYYNLRKVMPKVGWDKLRRQVYAHYQYQCAGCRRGGLQLHAHEVWKFNDKGFEFGKYKYKRKQTLIRIVCLCELCHSIEHMGHTEMLGGKAVAKAVRHAIDNLGWTHQQFMKRRQAAFDKWQERNAYEWKVDFGPYKHLVPKEVR